MKRKQIDGSICTVINLWNENRSKRKTQNEEEGKLSRLTRQCRNCLPYGKIRYE